MEEAHHRARKILEEKRSALDEVAALLQEKEVISGAEAEAVLEKLGLKTRAGSPVT